MAERPDEVQPKRGELRIAIKWESSMGERKKLCMIGKVYPM